MPGKADITSWLPITRKEVELRGWDALDVILISGDAYVDHPSFGSAVIGRIIESMGLRVAIIPQPNWRDDLRDFKKMGKPRLFFGVTAGNMDSMVNHYTANRRLRSDDAYTPGGKAGFRPDYASVVYCRILKELFPDVPVVLGGIEASLRRVTHYDYWSDQLKPSVLVESGADLLMYGMGEKGLRELLELLEKGVPIETLTTLPQTAVCIKKGDEVPQRKGWQDIQLAAHETCLRDKRAFASNFKHVEQESNRMHAARLIQDVASQTVLINPPYAPLSEKEMDTSFDLPYTRLPHPKYHKRGDIPAYTMIRHSINLHRGCFGGCSFCTISAHQGKFIASRSEDSVMREVESVVEMPDFKGTITDLGGPSANMYRMKGTDPKQCESCKRPSCIFPKVCANLHPDHRPLTALYKKVAAHARVKRVFIGSGIRYDMLQGFTPKQDRQWGLTEYTRQVVGHHVSGRLKVAPEHTSDEVLRMMRKPSFRQFREFKKTFTELNQQFGLKQQLIPYFISSHPGCHLADMADLAMQTKALGYKLEQVQDFTPTPMTLATVIYYSGIHPYTGKSVFTAKSKNEKLDQRKFFFWYKPENRQWIGRQLGKMGKPNLFGNPRQKRR